MQARKLIRVRTTVEGTIDRLDLINRMIALRAGDDVVVYDVPVSCEILLNGQRVKMHVLQVNDQVLVTCCSPSNDPRASRIDVQSPRLAMRRG
jgi:hypothetical protein